MMTTKLKNVLATMCAFLLAIGSSSAQTGPGGVGTPATVGYWIDVESNGGGNGALVSTMKDYSVGGIDAVQTDVTLQPEYQTNVVNGRSALFFNGSQRLVSPGHSVLDGPSYLEYYVFGDINLPATVDYPLMFDYGSGFFQNFTGFLTFGGSMYSRGRSGVTGNTPVSRAIGAPTGFNLYQGSVNGSLLTANLNYSLVGVKAATTAIPATCEGVSIGGLSNSSGITGHIAEVFAFTAALNTAEIKILQNYMDAKYNSGFFGTATDMYDYQTDYGLGVIGIGRDDASNEHSVSLGNGIVQISKTGLSDGEYLFIGDDGIDLTVLSTNVPAVVGPGNNRLERIWRMDEPTDIGGIDIVFDLDVTTNWSGDPASYRILINNSDDFSTVTSSALGTYNAVDETITFTNVDMDAGDYFTLGGDQPLSITSVTSGLWNSPSTWDCNCIPSIYTDVTVATGHLVFISGGASAFTKDFLVEANAFLSFGALASIEIKEDLTVTGSIISVNDGDVVFSGILPQSIDLSGNTIFVSSLTIDNLSGVTLLNNGINVNRVFSPLNGNFDVSAGELIIVSDGSTTSGRVGEMGPNASVTGDVSVERFIPSGLAGNRNISSPVISADLSQWDDSLLISGTGFPDGCAFDSSGCYYSVKKYLGGSFAGSFIDVTNPNEPLTNMHGFEVFMGDNLNTFGGATLLTKGSLNGQADIQISNATAGWNLVGNPYASPITFQGLERFRFGNYFYVFDAASGSYQWYDGSTNTSSITELADGNIAIGQGFWTFAGTGNFLRFKQTAKISTDATFIRNSEIENGIQLTLKQENSTFFNKISVAFLPDPTEDTQDPSLTSDGFDDFDMHYLSTGLEKASSLYIKVNDSVKLAKNYLEKDGQDKVIDFSLNCKTDSYYTIYPSNLVDFKAYDNVYLFDKPLNRMVNLQKEGSYTFYGNVGDEERFSLILSKNVLADKDYLSTADNGMTDDKVSIKQLGHTIEFKAYEGLENANIEVSNVVGQKIISNYSLDNSTAKQYLTIDNNQSGIFIVVVRAGGQIVATKKIIL